MDLLGITRLNEPQACDTVWAVSSIGRNVKRARLRAGLTQNQLAAATGLGKTQISDIERGRYRRPDTTTLATLSTALKCSLDELVGLPALQDYSELTDKWPILQQLRQLVDHTDGTDQKQETWRLFYKDVTLRAGSLMAAIGALCRSLKIELPDVALVAIDDFSGLAPNRNTPAPVNNTGDRATTDTEGRNHTSKGGDSIAEPSASEVQHARPLPPSPLSEISLAEFIKFYEEIRTSRRAEGTRRKRHRSVPKPPRKRRKRGDAAS